MLWVDLASTGVHSLSVRLTTVRLGEVSGLQLIELVKAIILWRGVRGIGV